MLAATTSAMLMAVGVVSGNAAATPPGEAQPSSRGTGEQQDINGDQDPGRKLRNSGTGLCVTGPVDGDQIRGKVVFQYDCMPGVEEQLWRFESQGGDSEGHGLYWIRNLYTDMCLMVPGDDNRNGAYVRQYDCLSGVKDELWFFEFKGADSEGHELLWIRNSYTERCLTVPSGELLRGAKAFQYDCLAGSKEQLWFLALD
ncbi:RICIN domain-containing protein [Amycolatopsis sp. NPDC051071]|uniref:RICIN domain-containing protein n=1 Tax=Amycolatopsis sp. NPDC051071 TaxID=3154637 RepID=UPI00343825F9